MPFVMRMELDTPLHVLLETLQEIYEPVAPVVYVIFVAPLMSIPFDSQM